MPENGVQEDDNSVFELQGYKNIIISPQVKSQIIVFKQFKKYL